MGLRTRLLHEVCVRAPGLAVVRSDGVVLLRRHVLLERPALGIYLHHCAHPDEASDVFHDHPWAWSAALVLTGGYTEERAAPGQHTRRRDLKPGRVNWIPADCFHRIAALPADGAWTIYVRGRRARADGFLVRTPEGWRHEPSEGSSRERKVKFKPGDAPVSTSRTTGPASSP
ncbi:MAG: hypothetical protein H6739_07920 [Alphaproteobacteria bacterium]|nr:hypothetical protein [Alphaproteobacteria bacterium]